MANHNGVARLFRLGTPGLLSADVICAFGLNLEIGVQVKQIPAQLLGSRSKLAVTGVKVPFGEPNGLYGGILVEAQEECQFWGVRTHQSVGGGSANFIAVSRQLQAGLKHPSRFGMVASIGRGDKADALKKNLRLFEAATTRALGKSSPLSGRREPPWFMPEMSPVEFGLLASKGTSVTLSLRDQSGTNHVLLYQKRPLDDEHGGRYEAAVEAIRSATPKVLVLNSIKATELSAAESLVRAFDRRQTYVVFSPHAESMLTEPERSQVQLIGNRSDLLAMNHDEAQLYLGEDSPFGSSNPFSLEKPHHRFALASALHQIGATTSIVTFGKYGTIGLTGKSEGVIEPAWIPRAPERDPVGCGDALLATVVDSLILMDKTPAKGKRGGITSARLRAAIRRGNIVAGIISTHLGPSSGVPSRAEVAAIMKKSR